MRRGDGHRAALRIDRRGSWMRPWTPIRQANAKRYTTQPANSWKKPEAYSTPNHWPMSPVATTRAALAKIVIGTAETTNRTVVQPRGSMRYAQATAPASREIKRADPAARLGDAQADLAQMDDVAVEQDRHAEQIERPRRLLGGQVLQREGHRVEEDGRQRHHEDQIGEGKQDDTEDPRPQVEEDEAGEDHDQRAAHEEVLCADVAEQEDPEACQQHRQTDATSRGGSSGAERGALARSGSALKRGTRKPCW